MIRYRIRMDRPCRSEANLNAVLCRARRRSESRHHVSADRHLRVRFVRGDAVLLIVMNAAVCNGDHRTHAPAALHENSHPALAPIQGRTQLNIAHRYVVQLARRVLVKNPDQVRRTLADAIPASIHDDILNRYAGRVPYEDDRRDRLAGRETRAVRCDIHRLDPRSVVAAQFQRLGDQNLFRVRSGANVNGIAR